MQRNPAGLHGHAFRSYEVVTDVRGELSPFLETFHRHLALCVKSIRGWPGEVFDKDSTSTVELLTPEATIRSLAYLIANPVEAMAVRYVKDWPGAQTLPRDIGSRVVKAQRPPHFFRPNKAQWPERIELPLQMPTALELDYGTELAQQRIAERVRELEHRAWQESKRTGIAFVGGQEAAGVQCAVRQGAGRLDLGQAQRALPNWDLVDAGASRGTVRAGAVALSDRKFASR